MTTKKEPEQQAQPVRKFLLIDADNVIALRQHLGTLPHNSMVGHRSNGQRIDFTMILEQGLPVKVDKADADGNPLRCSVIQEKAK